MKPLLPHDQIDTPFEVFSLKCHFLLDDSYIDAIYALSNTQVNGSQINNSRTNTNHVCDVSRI